MTNRIPRSLALATALVGCLPSPCDEPGNGDGVDRPAPNLTPPKGTTCPQVLQPVPIPSPDRVVGNGSANSCTEEALRTAILSLNAAGGGTLTFNCGASPHVITLGAELFVDAAITMDGGNTITLSGGNTTRIINCDHYAQLTLQNITLANGSTADSGSAIHLPWFGRLKVINVIFRDNRCTREDSDIGGAIFGGGLTEFTVSGSTFVGNRASNGGAIVNNGSNLSIINGVFANNVAFGHGGSSGNGGLGGAVYIDGMHTETSAPLPFTLCGSMFRNNESNGHGSAVFAYFYPGQEATIRQCEFDSNQVLNGATGGALYQEGAPLALSECAFIRNTAQRHAGAIFIGTSSPTSITNCSFVENSVPEVGAAIFSVAQNITILNATFSQNSADYGPAVYSETGNVQVRNTIFDRNTAKGPYNGQSCSRTLNGGAHNLQWPPKRPNGSNDTPCVAGITFENPLLTPLADNGGPTRTMAPGSGSPALDHGVDCPERDQRGEPRQPACDVGACEAP